MECKVTFAHNASSSAVDLIDTLWNVKQKYQEMLQKAERDLIDTLWNVKDFVLDDFLNTPPRFNRYIVECKVLTNVDL